MAKDRPTGGFRFKKRVPIIKLPFGLGDIKMNFSLPVMVLNLLQLKVNLASCKATSTTTCTRRQYRVLPLYLALVYQSSTHCDRPKNNLNLNQRRNLKMALSKKHQTVGQRYQIGDRVYRKSVTLGSGNGQKYRTRYGTITEVDTNIPTQLVLLTTSIWSSGKVRTAVLLPNIFSTD